MGVPGTFQECSWDFKGVTGGFRGVQWRFVGSRGFTSVVADAEVFHGVSGGFHGRTRGFLRFSGVSHSVS